MNRRRPEVPKGDLDDQFEAFLKESISSGESSLDSARVAKFLRPKSAKTKPPQPHWLDDASDSDDGLVGTGKSFLKPKKIANEPPPFLKTKSNVQNGDTNVSRDSLDDVSLGIRNGPKAASSGIGVPNLSLGSTSFTTDTMTGDVERNDPGLDTLAEISEKKKFFEELERNSGGTLDYSRLNKELDYSSTLPENKGKAPAAVVSQDESESEEEKERITVRNKEQEEEDKRQSMLSKVALNDSLDSTLGTKLYTSQENRGDDMGAIPEDPEKNADSWLNNMLEKHSADQKVSLKTGTGLDNTNTSQEMEALQQALKHAGMSTMGSIKELGTLAGSSSAAIETKTENTAQTNDPDRTQHSSGFGLEPVLPSTEKSTVDELLDQVKNLDRQTPTNVERRKQWVQFADEQRVQSDSEEEERGLNLSPAPEASRGFDLSPANTKSFEESQHTERQPHHCQDSSPAPPVRPVAKPRKGSLSHVKSSGYGQISTLERSKASENDISIGTPTSKDRRKSQVPVKEVDKKSSKNRIAAKWSPMSISQEKIKGSGVPTKSKGKSDANNPQHDQQLLASVNSFANYIRDHFGPFDEPQPKSSPRIQYSQEEPVRSSSQKLDLIEREKALLGEVKDWQEQWKQERKINNKLRIEVEHLEKDNLRRLEDQRQNFEEQLFKLKQENYVLQAQISEGHPSDLQKKLNHLAESGTISSEQIERLEKEIQEQEKLLLGYQQENERLYQQMKQLQTVTRTTEDKLFRENDKLKTEVHDLKEKLERKEIELKTKGIITSSEAQQQIAAEAGGSAVLGAGRIAQLEAELKLAKQREDHLLQDVDMLTKTKQGLEAAINQLIKKVQEFERNVEDAKKHQSMEVKDLQKQHQADLEKLNRRLKWYAENQQFLDEDAEIIKKKDAEIAMLQERLNNVPSEKKQMDMKNRAKERAADARRIQDLERQVKEMEGILRKRNPNSLPVLMWAASSAPDPEEKAPSVEFLEKQVEKLQKELEGKDEDAKRSIRAMEQKFSAVKHQYEERINTLESRLYKYERPKDDDHPHYHIAALNKEMDAVKERHRKKVAELEAEVERNKNELHLMKVKETANQQKAAEKNMLELHNKLSSQNLQLSIREQENSSLNGTIERLQKEKLQLQTELARMSDNTESSTKSDKSGKGRGRSGSRSGPSNNAKNKTMDKKNTQNLRPYTTSPQSPRKVYEPTAFAGSHINDVYKENEKMKVKFEKLQLHQEQEKVRTQKLLAESEERERKAREELEHQLAELRINHQQEVNKLLTEQVKVKSTSKITELQNQLDTQNVVVRHLKQQVNESGILSEKISTLKIKETVLEEHVKQLSEELEEAKKSFSPEMRHFQALQEKLEQMEKRHAQREQELQAIVAQSRLQAANEMDEESSKWKALLESKNQEVEKFRSELDSILSVLRELQRQGVLLPGQNR